jgi:hypothetical protein
MVVVMRITTRRILAGASVALIAALVPTIPAAANGGGHGHHSTARVLLRSNLLGSLTTDPVLFGKLVPGTVDWSVSRSNVTVLTNGKVDVQIRDLILPRDGNNPLPLLSATLVCNGVPGDMVGPVPFNTDGDARITDTFTVPDRCLAPAVLINPLDRDGVYIAATGAAS